MHNNLDFLSPFQTTEFEYTSESIVDITLQQYYDGSVNIITTCKDTKPRIVNSRQRFNEDSIDIVVRKNEDLDNVYSNLTMDKTILIPQLSDVVPNLTFIGVIPGSGKLMNGGYKYYFRLKTSDGNESPIIEESRLVSIHTGTGFGKACSYIDNTQTKNSVQFTIDNIDTKVYRYVSVYYTRATGQVKPTIKTAYHINRDFEIIQTSNYIGSCSIAHTGFEEETPIDISKLTIEYTPIISANTLTQKNNRLLLGNIVTQPTADDRLKAAALACYILKEPDSKLFTEQLIDNGLATTDDTYANPDNIYKKLGYFPGETYEFAINFVFKNGSVSPSYPIMGMDYVQAGNLIFKEFNPAYLGTGININDGWLTDGSGQNDHGVVRMKYIPIENTFTQTVTVGKNLSQMDAHSMHIDTTLMNSPGQYLNDLKTLNVISYFISRRKRVPDLLMEGLITLAGTAPIGSMYPTEMTTYILGMKTGYGLEGSLSENLVLFPLPGSAMPVSGEGLDSSGTTQSSFYYDGILYAPLASAALNKYYAFYSPDITSDTASTSILNTKNNYILQVSSYLSQNIAYKEATLISCLAGSSSKTRYPYCANPYRFSTTTMNGLPIDKIRYVDDGVRGFSSMDFTARLDRQVALALYTVLRSYAEVGDLSSSDPNNVLLRSRQLAFYTANLVNTKDINYISNRVIGHFSGPSYPWDTTDPACQIPMSGVKYSPYLGLIIKDSTVLTTGLSMVVPVGGEAGYFTGYADKIYMLPDTDTTKMGAMARIYTNASGILSVNQWKDRYSIKRNDGYSAISRRFDIYTSLSKDIDWHNSFLTGGDCYSGIYYQRVWRPGGIDGIPTANNPRNYTAIPASYSGGSPSITRQGVNITNSGYSIGFPVRSSYNFALRALYDVSEAELTLYGHGRTYTSSLPDNETHGNRQPETSVINYGNIIDESVIEYKAYNSQLPFIELKYPNRLVVSEISNVGEFENGYRTFEGLNFKDYDLEQGEIVAITSVGLYTYIVFQNGVSLIEVSERVATTAESSNTNVYISSADALPPKSLPIFHNVVGSQHLKSVIATEDALIGLDVNSKKVWVVAKNEKKIISEHFIQSLLNQLITNDLANVISSYNVIFNELYFNFVYNDAHQMQKTLVFNVEHNQWYGTTDVHKWYQFVIDNQMMSLQRPFNYSDPTTIQPFNLYFPVTNTDFSPLFKEVGKATAIDDRQTSSKFAYDSYIEFVIKTEQLTKFNLSNIIINGNGIPTSIEVISESLHNYIINNAPLSVIGVNQEVLPLHTNIFMKDATITDLTYLDSYRFKRNKNDSFKVLSEGDRITLDLNNILKQFTIANITDNGDNTDTIVLNYPMTSTIINTLYYGWSVPIRISLGEFMSGKIKLTIPTKKHADLLSGIINTSQNNHVNYANAKPYGRWIKLRFNFSGIEQIYVESVISELIIHFS